MQPAILTLCTWRVNVLPRKVAVPRFVKRSVCIILLLFFLGTVLSHLFLSALYHNYVIHHKYHTVLLNRVVSVTRTMSILWIWVMPTKWTYDTCRCRHTYIIYDSMCDSHAILSWLWTAWQNIQCLWRHTLCHCHNQKHFPLIIPPFLTFQSSGEQTGGWRDASVCV